MEIHLISWLDEFESCVVKNFFYFNLCQHAEALFEANFLDTAQNLLITFGSERIHEWDIFPIAGLEMIMNQLACLHAVHDGHRYV